MGGKEDPQGAARAARRGEGGLLGAAPGGHQPHEELAGPGGSEGRGEPLLPGAGAQSRPRVSLLHALCHLEGRVGVSCRPHAAAPPPSLRPAPGWGARLVDAEHGAPEGTAEPAQCGPQRLQTLGPGRWARPVRLTAERGCHRVDDHQTHHPPRQQHGHLPLHTLQQRVLEAGRGASLSPPPASPPPPGAEGPLTSFPSYSRVPGGSGPSPLQAITPTGPRPPGAPRLPEHLDLATSPKPACPSGDNWDCTLVRRVWGGPEPRPAAGQGPGLSTWQCLEHGEPWAVPRLHTREWTPCRGQGEGAGARASALHSERPWPGSPWPRAQGRQVRLLVWNETQFCASTSRLSPAEPLFVENASSSGGLEGADISVSPAPSPSLQAGGGCAHLLCGPGSKSGLAWGPRPPGVPRLPQSVGRHGAQRAGAASPQAGFRTELRRRRPRGLA